MTLFLLNLIGGGGDLACEDCLPEAQLERAGEIKSISEVDAPGESCGWCGVEFERAA